MPNGLSGGSTQVKKHEADGELILEISGMIDENSTFADVSVPESMPLVLDLSGIERLNSMGLMVWLEWMKTLGRKRMIKLRKCPPPVVDQISILRGFVPLGGVVESVQVPYVCGSCQNEELVLAVRGHDYVEETADRKEGLTVPVTKACPKCQEEMEIDVVPAKYFAFLRKRA
jgi:anti-anti-sigma regulatory factor